MLLPSGNEFPENIEDKSLSFIVEKSKFKSAANCSFKITNSGS